VVRFAARGRIFPRLTLPARSKPRAQVVVNLSWDRGTGKIVFAHTHQPLDGVTATDGRGRYWDPGSRICEPALSSRDSYISYPGTPGRGR
jgi:hypothetical protein